MVIYGKLDDGTSVWLNVVDLNTLMHACDIEAVHYVETETDRAGIAAKKDITFIQVELDR